jgi:hypothetical protein
VSYPAADVFRHPLSHQREDGIWVFSRGEFNEFRFNYNPGEHVVFGGPSGAGKTTEAFGLLEWNATPTLPAYVAVSKPLDPVTTREGERLGFRRVSEWPPPKRVQDYGKPKPSGYLIWPKFGDIHTDIGNASALTSDLMAEVYAGGVKGHHGILVMDDTMVKAKILGLDRDMVTVLAMARAMGIGIWIFVQKPTDSGKTTLWGYENCSHLFLSPGGEGRSMDRYAEIGGGQYSSTIRRVLPTLERYQILYLHKEEGWICILDRN